ncbi:MAG: DUF2203 domain-containing protein [Cyanobacteria bacterium P01_A01_bin.17]
MSDSEQSSPPEDELNIEKALTEAEKALKGIRERYQNVQTAQQQQPQLQKQLQQLQDQSKESSKEQPPHQEAQQKLAEEIAKIREQLEITELTLESRLFTWRDKRDWFWHFLRFAGIGFGAALLLNYLTR